MDNIKIIETAVILVTYFVLKTLSYKSIDQTVKNSLMQKTRGKVIKKAVGLLLFLLAFTFILLIWGVDSSELVVFLGSVLTVIGIALVAQWSIISNVTAGVVIFFSHSVKLDDTITVMDKEFHIEGRVSDIGLFFLIIKTTEGELVSIPNNVFIQKMIKKKLSE